MLIEDYQQQNRNGKGQVLLKAGSLKFWEIIVERFYSKGGGRKPINS